MSAKISKPSQLPDKVPPPEPPPGSEEIDRDRPEKTKQAAKKTLKYWREVFKPKEDLKYFLESGADGKERYLLYSIIKRTLGELTKDESGIDRDTSLEELQTYFVEFVEGNGFLDIFFDEESDFAKATGLAFNGRRWYHVERKETRFRGRKTKYIEEPLLTDAIKRGGFDPKLVDTELLRFMEGKVREFEKKEKEPDEKELAAKGEEWFVLYNLLKEKEYTVDADCLIYTLRERFTRQRGEQNFGFYFTGNKWHTIDTSYKGEDENFATSNFLEAFDQMEGIKYELTEDTSDSPIKYPTAVATAINKARQRYQRLRSKTSE